jgi:hypothetical protein
MREAGFQHHRELGVSVLSFALILPQAPAWSATLTVGCTGTASDAVDLVNAVAAANDEILHPGSDVIILTPKCRYILSSANNWWYGPNGLPAVSTAIVIEGNGASIERADVAGTPYFRIAYVSGGLSGLPAGTLILRNLVLRNGLAHGGDSGLEQKGVRCIFADCCAQTAL